MIKVKKPNYKKWVAKESWTWWEAVCLLCEIDPPKSLEKYFQLEKLHPRLKKMRIDFRSKGIEKDLGIVIPDYVN